MSAGLTIAGAAFQLVGIALLFADLAAVAKQELGVLFDNRNWSRELREAGWLREFARSPKRTLKPIGIFVIFLLIASGPDEKRIPKSRPSDLKAGATHRERLEWLESYVRSLDQDIDTLDARTVRLGVHDSLENASRLGALVTQALGPLFVLVGLVLGTLGSLVA